MDLKIHKGITITGGTKEEIDRIKIDHTFINPLWVEAKKFNRRTYGIKQYIQLYKEYSDSLVVPRGSLYYLITTFNVFNEIIDETYYPPRKEILTNIQFRALQESWVEDLLQHRQGIAVAPAGSGKTVMALAAISRIGLLTLWLTHRQNLVDQLIQRATSFLNPGKIGIIGGGSYSIGDFITVALVQTLSRKRITKDENIFGTVVVDEAHITPVVSVSTVLKQLSPAYLYGITATPFRRDGLENVMHALVGPTIASISREEVISVGGIIPARIKIIQTNIKNLKIENETDFTKLTKYLSRNEIRNDLIIDYLIKELQIEENICVVLTTKIEHGQKLQKRLLERGFINSAHPHSKRKKSENRQLLEDFTSGKLRVVFATYKMLAEGFDYDRANRLLFASPIRNEWLLEQAIGRIERIAEGKKDAEVLDFVDPNGLLQNQAKSREICYMERKMEITYH